METSPFVDPQLCTKPKGFFMAPHLKPLDQGHEEHKAHSSVQVTLGSQIWITRWVREKQNPWAKPLGPFQGPWPKLGIELWSAAGQRYILKRGGCENLTLVFWNRAVALPKWYFETYMRFLLSWKVEVGLWNQWLLMDTSLLHMKSIVNARTFMGLSENRVYSQL